MSQVEKLKPMLMDPGVPEMSLHPQHLWTRNVTQAVSEEIRRDPSQEPVNQDGYELGGSWKVLRTLGFMLNSREPGAGPVYSLCLKFSCAQSEDKNRGLTHLKVPE